MPESKIPYAQAHKNHGNVSPFILKKIVKIESERYN